MSGPWGEVLAGFAGGLIAGAVNSVAGGGTMISFPLLIFVGLPPIIANATNTIGIWPGSIGSVIGFRQELQTLPRRMFWLCVPAGLGGGIGALILTHTPAEQFERVVPWLLLLATLLFLVQPQLRAQLDRLLKTGHASVLVPTTLLFLVAIYGGYFGAGMSILMLSLLGLIGLRDMLVMTATTSLLSILINGAASAVFVAAGLVRWPVALAMMVGAISSGYFAAGWARRAGRDVIRRLVLAMAVVITIVLFIRR